VNRDPIGERGGIALYEFVHNYPIGGRDLLGAVDVYIRTKTATGRTDLGSSDNAYVELDEGLPNNTGVVGPKVVPSTKRDEMNRICAYDLVLWVRHNGKEISYKTGNPALYTPHSTGWDEDAAFLLPEYRWDNELVVAPSKSIIVAHEKGHIKTLMEIANSPAFRTFAAAKQFAWTGVADELRDKLIKLAVSRTNNLYSNEKTETALTAAGFEKHEGGPRQMYEADGVAAGVDLPAAMAIWVKK